MPSRLFYIAGSVILGAGGVVSATTPAPTRAITFVAKMTGPQESPSNQSAATGTATFSLDGGQLAYSVEVKRLSGAPREAHIHVGVPSAAGPSICDIVLRASVGRDGLIALGHVDLTKEVSPGVSGDSLGALLKTGNAYVNVHTWRFPDGEIRGQVMQEL